MQLKLNVGLGPVSGMIRLLTPSWKLNVRRQPFKKHIWWSISTVHGHLGILPWRIESVQNLNLSLRSNIKKTRNGSWRFCKTVLCQTVTFAWLWIWFNNIRQLSSKENIHTAGALHCYFRESSSILTLSAFVRLGTWVTIYFSPQRKFMPESWFYFLWRKPNDELFRS